VNLLDPKVIAKLIRRGYRKDLDDAARYAPVNEAEAELQARRVEAATEALSEGK
jgi:hypothetical protein